MPNSKIFSKNKFLTLLLIAYFVISGTVLVAHNFSHQIAKDFPGKIILNSENSALLKIIFSDGIKNDLHSGQKNQGPTSCDLCSLFAFNNQLLTTTLISYLILSCYFIRNFRVNDKIKLSYLRTSFLSRAPPFIS
jgi:hypothetical protein